MEEYEGKDPFTPLIVKSFWKIKHFKHGYFALLSPNHLVERDVKYIWYVKKLVILSHDLIMF
jgi:hypothetical protein